MTGVSEESSASRSSGLGPACHSLIDIQWVRRSLRPMATKAQCDCEELLIFSYGCLTKRKEGAAKLRNGVDLVFQTSWAAWLVLRVLALTVGR